MESVYGVFSGSHDNSIYRLKEATTDSSLLYFVSEVFLDWCCVHDIRMCLHAQIVSLVAAVAALKTVLLVLVVIFCAYGTVGMELFGGIIKCDMEHLPPKGPDMEDPTDWGVLNFNDFFASLVTLFLLTVNGWDDSLKALVKHTSVFSCGAYFVSFYILTDTIILNLLVALVLEAYDQVASSSSSSWRPVL